MPIGSVVANNHSTGTSFAGGFASRTRTTLAVTAGSDRYGGRCVTVAARTSTTALRWVRGCRRALSSHARLAARPRTEISRETSNFTRLRWAPPLRAFRSTGCCTASDSGSRTQTQCSVTREMMDSSEPERQ